MLGGGGGVDVVLVICEEIEYSHLPKQRVHRYTSHSPIAHSQIDPDPDQMHSNPIYLRGNMS